MALTKDFKGTIRARAQRDPAFRKALLQEGVECLLAGDIDTGEAVLRDYINATIGFEELGLRGIVWVPKWDFIAVQPYNSSVFLLWE